MTCAVFGRTIGAQFLSWDDHGNVSENPDLNPPAEGALQRIWTGPQLGLYIPVTLTGWWLLASFAWNGAALSAVPFHLANVLLHCAVALVVLALLRDVLRQAGAPTRWRDWAAAAGALLFAVHPLQVEPVSWVTGLKDVLGGLLSFAAIWAFLRTRSDGPWWRHALPTALFLAAILAKPASVAAPVMAFVLHVFALRRPVRQVWPLLLWVVMALPIVYFTRRLQGDETLEFVTPWNWRPLVAMDALAFYLRKLAWPALLAADYGRTPSWTIANASRVLAVGLPVLLAAVAIVALKRTRWLLAGAALFVAGLLPVLGLVPFVFQNHSTVADRYAYLSLFGPALLLAVVLAVYPKGWLRMLAAAFLLCCVVISFTQAGYWSDDHTFFARELVLNPQSQAFHTNLGQLLDTEGRTQEAIEHYQLAIAAKPHSPARQAAYTNLGALYAKQGKTDLALSQYRLGVEARPTSVAALTGLASALHAKGQSEEAIEVLQRALQLNPRDSDALYNLGNVYLTRKQWADASAQYRLATEGRTAKLPVYLNYGMATAMLSQWDRSLELFTRATEIAPGSAEAHNGRARVLAQLNRLPEAAAEYTEALRINPRLVQARSGYNQVTQAMRGR